VLRASGGWVTATYRGKYIPRLGTGTSLSQAALGQGDVQAVAGVCHEPSHWQAICGITRYIPS